MAKPISKFFLNLGYPLRNVQWSWGARKDDSILLRAWEDEFKYKEKRLLLLDESDRYLDSESAGLDERIVQLQALWAGSMAGYAVIVTARDRQAQPRKIAAYRDDAVFALKQLVTHDNGAVSALVGEMVDIAELDAHSTWFRTLPAEGLFPLDDGVRSGMSTSTYEAKLPAIRAWLIEVCRRQEAVVYSDVIGRFGLIFYTLRSALSRLGRECMQHQEPILTALVVDKETRRCSTGFASEFHIEDDEAERQRCYAYWAEDHDEKALVDASGGIVDSADEFEQRVARFALVEVRPQQSAFRSAVFRACLGRCVISGCMVPEALEAAHLFGRDWRQGHNSAQDGILLRRDLHTLYDRELLKISAKGEVSVRDSIFEYYSQFSGVRVELPHQG